MYKDFIISFSESTKYISHGTLRDDLSQSNGWPIHLIIGLWACRSTIFTVISFPPVPKIFDVRSSCIRDIWCQVLCIPLTLMSGPPAPELFDVMSSFTKKFLCQVFLQQWYLTSDPPAPELFDVMSFCTKYNLCRVFLQQVLCIPGTLM